MLPAYAGMILEDVAVALGHTGAPRVCGDDPRSTSETLWTAWCSPRMRG